ncbi:MAG: ribonuclease Y [Endomicrobium sp.]|jgi:ribonuclease Y|nr:ribonuclease Y [Endomicrobium sp.]
MLNFIIIGIVLLIACFIGYILRLIYDKINAQSLEQMSERIINEAKLIADTKLKESLLEAKNIVDKERKEFEKEIRDRKQHVQNVENRIHQREENLDKKILIIDQKEKELTGKEKSLHFKEEQIKTKLADLDAIQNKQQSTLEHIACMTKKEAKSQILFETKSNMQQELTILSQRLEQETRESADRKSKEILAIAIQRIAAEYTMDNITTTVNIPNEEIKGRVIGREGRNIRAFEQITGVDLIIDDTPETITVSSFDGVRREIARIALEKLVMDGRIHPSRIEDIVARVKLNMEQHIKDIGTQAVIDAGVTGVHPEIIKLLGKLKYRTSYGQNQLQHTLEVTWIAKIIASELGVDVNFCKKGALLHDIGKAVNHEVDGSHHQISAEIARKYGESTKMINAILSHHEGFALPETAEAFVIAAADAISASRPGARMESIEFYVKRLAKLEKIAKGFHGVLMAYAIQAGREVRILVKPDCIDDIESQILAHKIAKRIECELEYPGQIKVTVIREIRSQDIAK